MVPITDKCKLVSVLDVLVSFAPETEGQVSDDPGRGDSPLPLSVRYSGSTHSGSTHSHHTEGKTVKMFTVAFIFTSRAKSKYI